MPFAGVLLGETGDAKQRNRGAESLGMQRHLVAAKAHWNPMIQ